MFEQLITESLTNATQADVRELRSMYYGRLDMFVSFSDDSKIQTDQKDLPTGIVSHKVEDVVGRKVKVSELYGHVFRVKKSRGRVVESIKAYSMDDLHNDINKLKDLPYVYEDDVDEIVPKVMSNRLIRSNFDRFWEITRALTDGLSDLWSRILVDIGYIGFNDPDGLGLFSRRGQPTALIINQARIETFDILKVQTRNETRSRIRDDVEREVKKMQTRRKRVQKKDRMIKTKKSEDILSKALAYQLGFKV